MKLLRVLAVVSLLVSGCGARINGVKKGDKSLGRFNVGEEERYEVKCMEGSSEEVYVWIRVSRDSLAYDNEKRVWDFIGQRKKDGKVLRVISNSCRMVMEVLI